MLERLLEGETKFPQGCTTRWVKDFKPLFKVYNDMGDILYSVAEPTSALLKCENSASKALRLNGTGYLHLPGDCSFVVEQASELFSRRKSKSSSFNLTSVHAKVDFLHDTVIDELKPLNSKGIETVSKANTSSHWAKLNETIHGLKEAVSSIDKDNELLFSRTEDHYFSVINSWVGTTVGPIVIILVIVVSLLLWRRMKRESESRRRLTMSVRALGCAAHRTEETQEDLRRGSIA